MMAILWETIGFSTPAPKSGGRCKVTLITYHVCLHVTGARANASNITLFDPFGRRCK